MTDLHRLDRRVAGLFARYDALLEHERDLFVPTPERFEAILSEIRAAQEDVRRMATQDGRPVTTVVLANIDEVLDAMNARVRTDEQFPDRFVSQIARKITALLGLDPRPEAERADVIAAIADRTATVLDAVADLAPRIPEDNRGMVIRALDQLAVFVTQITAGGIQAALPSLPPVHLDVLTSRLKALTSKAQEAMARIRGTSSAAVGRHVEGLSYAETLKRVYGIEIDELLQWYREEVEHNQAGLHAKAATLDASRNAYRILEMDLGPYDSPDAMFSAMTVFVARARSLARDYITLPESETCHVWRVPEYLKDSYPWGGYFSFGSALAGQPRGAVFLNAYNYRTVTKGWVILNAIHECYPGHHAQFAKTAAADMPLSFKVATLTSRAAPLAEGIAVRTETLMQDVLGESVFPLFVAYRRLHTSLRIWVDLLLHHFQENEEAAVDLYVEYLHLTRPVAQGQVYSQRLTPGYFTTYYYGLQILKRIQAECGWDDRRFTEMIFSCGKVSLAMLTRLIALPERERDGLLQRFSALAP